MRTRYLGWALALALVSASSSADAVRLVASFDGFVHSGVDTFGQFGQAGADLSGKTVNAKYFIDDQAPGVTNISGMYSRTTHASSSFEEEYSGHMLGRISVNGKHFDVEGRALSGFFGEPRIRSASVHSRDDNIDMVLNAGVSNILLPFNSGGYTVPGTYLALYPGPVPLHSFNYQVIGSPSQGTALSLIFDSLTVSQGWDDADASPPPTDHQLAQMSAGAYPSTIPPPVDRFSISETKSGYDGFGATVYRAENQIVVAFRGTLMDDSKTEIANFVADRSFTSGRVTNILNSNFQQATSLLLSLQSECPSCEFNLTGHSLGGAIAQILGEFSNLPATGFNAPGAGALLQNLAMTAQSSALENAHFINEGSNRNLRAYGDVVSLIGLPIGSQQTVDTPNNDKATSIPRSLLNFRTLHSVNNIVASLECIQLISGCGLHITPGTVGPPLPGDMATVIADGLVTLKNVKFIVQVAAGEYYAFDPAGYEHYEFIGSVGSPYMDTLVLPELEGVFQYQVAQLSDGIWGNSFYLFDNSPLKLGENVNGFRFIALDALAKPFEVSESFAFLVSFKSTGTFNGDLSMNNLASVPEPSTWLIMLLGFGMAGRSVRRNQRRFA